MYLLYVILLQEERIYIYTILLDDEFTVLSRGFEGVAFGNYLSEDSKHTECILKIIAAIYAAKIMRLFMLLR